MYVHLNESFIFAAQFISMAVAPKFKIGNLSSIVQLLSKLLFSEFFSLASLLGVFIKKESKEVIAR